MGIEHEEAVRSFLRAFEGENLDSTQIERIVSRMAPDARYHSSHGKSLSSATTRFAASYHGKLR